MILEIASLIPVGSWLMGKLAEKGFDLIYTKLSSSDEINRKFYKAVSAAAEKTQRMYPHIMGGDIEFFFKSEPIFGELVKLLFKLAVVDIKKIEQCFDSSSLPKNLILEFINHLKIELVKDRELDQILSDKEIFVMVQGINESIEVIRQNSTLTVMEISAIRDILEERIGSAFNFENFIENYRRCALIRLSQVNFLGLGMDSSIQRKGKNLQSIFVPPNFSLHSHFSAKARRREEELVDGAEELDIADSDNFFDFATASEEEDIVSYERMFDFSNKIVVLGNPGSGKSVLVKSVICQILGLTCQFGNIEIVKTIPFRIELRKYLAFKKSRGGNLLHYLILLLEEDYYISGLTTSILENILKNRKCLMFFDGLDEIFKVEDKLSIKDDIESFHTMYPSIKSLTTSRIIGYEEAPLNDVELTKFSILNFSDDQVVEYISKWYTQEEEDDEIRDNEINGFLAKKNEIDSELLRNPLLLSLIVILYRNTLKLPESKLEIYQSCTRTLVDKWDASKELIIDLDPDVSKNKEKILADLAWWQYEKLSGETVVITYERARKAVGASIKDKLKIDDEFLENELAEAFMIYAQRRSIYFDNNFTHKTFLEYYTAYWIYSNIEKKHKIPQRNDLIAKYISNPFWHIVFELLFNMIDKDQADSEIMDELVENQIKTSALSLPFILSTISTFKNVSERAFNLTVSSTVDWLIENGRESLNGDNSYHPLSPDSVFDGIAKLFWSQPRFSLMVRNCIIKYENVDTADAAYILYFEILWSKFGKLEGWVFDLSNENLLNERLEKSPYLFRLYCLTTDAWTSSRYMTVLQYVIEHFGVKELFSEHSSVYDNFFIGAWMSQYFYIQTKKENVMDIVENLNFILSKGIAIDHLVQFITSMDFFHLELTPRSREIILDKLDVENDNSFRKLFLTIFFSDQRYYNISMNGEEFRKLAKGRRTEKLLTKLYKMGSTERNSAIANLIWNEY